MAEKAFTPSEWSKIADTLQVNPARYGFPERVYGSVVLGSFNIRKLGSPERRSKGTWQFLAEVCRHFDLLAIQEVMDDLRGIRRLKELLGPDFGLIVSDKTGAFPGDPGLGERLGFLYNRLLVQRTEIATDVTYDRSKILTTIAESNDPIHSVMAPYADKLTAYGSRLEAHLADPTKAKPRRPKFDVKMPVFLSFIRSPFCASFEIKGHPGTTPYQFMAINAHLYFGQTIRDRRQEFDALMDWINSRVKENDKAYYPSFILLGDLNLDFDNPERDRPRIERHIKTFNDDTGSQVTVNFPFLDPHPVRKKLLRTNARLTETFDQIGLFVRDNRIPSHVKNAEMGQDREGPDYGVFDFVDLFSESLLGEPFGQLTKTTQKSLIARFEHNVSDHMPLWIRLPLPVTASS